MAKYFPSEAYVINTKSSDTEIALSNMIDAFLLKPSVVRLFRLLFHENDYLLLIYRVGSLHLVG